MTTEDNVVKFEKKKAKSASAKPASRTDTANVVVAFPKEMVELLRVLVDLVNGSSVGTRYTKGSYASESADYRWSISRLIGAAIDRLLSEPISGQVDISNCLPSKEELFGPDAERVKFVDGIFEAAIILYGQRDLDRTFLAEKVKNVLNKDFSDRLMDNYFSGRGRGHCDVVDLGEGDITHRKESPSTDGSSNVLPISDFFNTNP